jgi:cytochrome c peroxidase
MPLVPDDNPMTVEKVALGRALFYDQRLSVNGTMACATCHEQARAFTTDKPTPTGATRQSIPRNALTLTNVAYAYPYTWQNPLLHGLEAQALVPMFADSPIELGLGAVIGDILDGFRVDPVYRALFPRAFARVYDPFTPEVVPAALASFERTLISGQSPYDRFVYQGDGTALTASAQAGMALFFSERFECYHCHAGITFTSAFRTAASRGLPSDYQNDGLYNLDARGAYPASSPGLSAITGDPTDNGKFRVPTLRNIELSSPYMHDGSIPTLDAVLDHYAAGGRNIVDGPNAGDGRRNVNKSPLVRGFTLAPDERAALLDFLRSLTDPSFVSDPSQASPW